MHKNIKAFCLAGIGTVVILTAGWLKPLESCRVSANDCYAVCTYEGSKRRWIGISSGGCSACEEAEKKCRDNHDNPCTKIRCTATDCGKL